MKRFLSCVSSLVTTRSVTVRVLVSTIRRLSRRSTWGRRTWRLPVWTSSSGVRSVSSRIRGRESMIYSGNPPLPCSFGRVRPGIHRFKIVCHWEKLGRSRKNSWGIGWESWRQVWLKKLSHWPKRHRRKIEYRDFTRSIRIVWSNWRRKLSQVGHRRKCLQDHKAGLLQIR